MNTPNQRSAKDVKLDATNRRILAIVHKESNISNAELAKRIGLSTAACSQRTNALRSAGYFISFTAEVDLNRICKHVIAYVEFTLERNDPASRAKFIAAIGVMPEFMDCIRVSGDTDFVSFTCCSNIAELNRLCDELSSNASLRIKRVVQRVVLDRPKWFLGYPIAKLKWLDE